MTTLAKYPGSSHEWAILLLLRRFYGMHKIKFSEEQICELNTPSGKGKGDYEENWFFKDFIFCKYVDLKVCLMKIILK